MLYILTILNILTIIREKTERRGCLVREGRKVQVDRLGRVLIPVKLRRQLEMTTQGQWLEFLIEGEQIILKRAKRPVL